MGRERDRCIGGDAGRIAIVGIGLRAPGGVEDLDGYRSLLRSGRSVIDELPSDRRDVFAKEWASTITRGGYLRNVFDFDADFFGMSPREARVVDPQQRLLLEVVWEAFEDAAIPPCSVGRDTGVFVGITGQDYRRWFVDDPTAHWTAGNGLSFASGRVAHLLDLYGPTASIDTACSSSLAALHSGCRSLEHGDCHVAVAAGVNLILAPWTTRALQRTGALSPDALSRPFDVAANGYVRAEGCVALVLKRLQDAVDDGDRIHAVIDGVGVNHDGGSSGFSAPSGRAQERLFRETLSTAGLEPEDIGFHEAHGTGTHLGDRVELASMSVGLASGRPLAVGAVKAAIGHAEAASGLLGLVKAVLCLTERRVYPQPGFTALPPDVDLDGTGIWIPREETDWPPNAGPGASVSSFGMSGTNVLALLSGPPGVLPSSSEGPSPGVMVSAETRAALHQMSARYGAWLAERADEDFLDFAATATAGRTRLSQTVWVRGGNAADIGEALRALARGEAHPLVDELGAQDPLPHHPRRYGRVVALPRYPWQRRTHVVAPSGDLSVGS